MPTSGSAPAKIEPEANLREEDELPAVAAGDSTCGREQKTPPIEEEAADVIESLAAGAKEVAGDRLVPPDAARDLASPMFDGTFLSRATPALMDGFVAVGKQVPVIGAIFGILGDLKTQADLYVASSKECQRLSVWCVSQIGTIGRLAKEAAIDPETEQLLRDAVPPLLSLQTMVAKRLKATQGTVGKLMGFWTSGEYMRQSDMAQKCVQAAIDSLLFRVEVDTRIDVQKVRDRCDVLPVMDQKLDDLLGLAKESNDMMNEILLLNKKKYAALVLNMGEDGKVTYTKELKGLDLDYTQITDAGCATLAAALDSGALPALEKLYLHNIPASAAAKSAVFAARPGLVGL